MFFLAARNWCGHPGSRMAFKTQKHQLFLSKTTCFDEKIKKTQCFFIVLGPVITRQLAFIFRPEWHGNFFFQNSRPPISNPNLEKLEFLKMSIGRPKSVGQHSRGQHAETPARQQSDLLRFWIGSVWDFPRFLLNLINLCIQELLHYTIEHAFMMRAIRFDHTCWQGRARPY